MGQPGWKTTIRGAIIMVSAVAALWVIEVFDYVLPINLDQFGILARDISGLPGIAFAPLLHDGFGHVSANSLPLLGLGILAAARGIGRFCAATAIIIVVGGIGVWLFAAPATITVGASGVVFGYFGYVVTRAILDRRLGDIVVAAIGVVAYGSIIWGVLPSAPHISWQGHLFGLIGGVIAAWLLRVAPATPRQEPVNTTMGVS